MELECHRGSSNCSVLALDCTRGHPLTVREGIRLVNPLDLREKVLISWDFHSSDDGCDCEQGFESTSRFRVVHVIMSQSWLCGHDSVSPDEGISGRSAARNVNQCTGRCVPTLRSREPDIRRVGWLRNTVTPMIYILDNVIVRSGAYQTPSRVT
ncbi:hypothetical protein J6590_064507 [Homalodisca vitripennis]|nr:hypothetical protein J6590_064507 [Homalodisca vitripennis]